MPATWVPWPTDVSLFGRFSAKMSTPCLSGFGADFPNVTTSLRLKMTFTFWTVWLG